jgi:ABC-2 type transport system ATP-binding protein
LFAKARSWQSEDAYARIVDAARKVVGDGAMIQVRGLVKEFYGFRALNGLNLHAQTGSIYGLVGVSGVGKTTILKHLAGVLKQDSREALIDGVPVYDNAAVKSRLGFVPDDPGFFPSCTIEGYAKLCSKLWKGWRSWKFN